MEFFISLSRGALGIAVLIGVCYLLSADRKAVDWRMVGIGLLLQIVLALAILKVPFVSQIFDVIAQFFQQVLEFTEAGAAFMFGGIVTDQDTFGYIFAFQVLPTIVFFSALSAILYYLGVLQWIIYGVAWVMKKTMRLSGPESLAAAANVFIGQTEAPLVVKPYLENFSRSEILCLMTGGMATIAGGVFAAYVGFLGSGDPEQELYFAKHLLTASIISAPAAIVAAKILYPETEEKDIEEQMQMTGDVGSNVLDAISRGTTDGLKLAINVGAMLLVFTALIYMLNVIFLGSTDLLNTLAARLGMADVNSWNEAIKTSTDGRFEGFTFTFLLGKLFAPVAWLLGTPIEDCTVVGQLLGQKTVINEFVAYAELNTLVQEGVTFQPKSIIIATYALCGFSNFASIGIQIGGIGAIAPGQRKTLSEFGIKALIGGTVACFLTACIAGVLI
ncbi:MAG: Na+ dependent nucleoside transporter [Saprospiraceae bacterium]|nr:Na+ dependent nucleoside transporter [Saprospiraceae bacterium]